ncbi:hypothetical protein A3194_12335 [Candidatus Thiodiazotropha endoloripes]|uniref:hypothetical protein n=1 Tax=Candidatus Thiodiazotropha endoloripes TaxID=1818881 RepID=UPI00083E214F|nr:hypothetical protein [Candidatus Thiodiazotropha endoloripes]ODB85616.1 hypothetical protein A3194_12335 [Candidatus Thiodiazotropha endoloripes]
MKMLITHNGVHIVDLDTISLNGREAAGGYAFSIILKGTRHSFEDPMFVFDISLSLSLSNPDTLILPSISSSTQHIQCHDFATDQTLHFEMLLMPEQLNAIEEHRQDNDLSLKLELRALTLSGSTFWSSYNLDTITVPRAEWLTALESSGFKRTILFEVPLPSVGSDLINLLSKAQEFIETGYYKEAVIQCRHIIEAIEKARDDKTSAKEANRNSQKHENREAMTANERLLSLREQLKNICHLGAHGDEHFTRSQARAVLGMTMALLAEPTVGFIKQEEFPGH